MTIAQVRDQLKQAVQIMQKMITDTNPESVADTYNSISVFLGSKELAAALTAGNDGNVIDTGQPQDSKAWPESTMIIMAVYFPVEKVLQIKFKNETVYQYHGVPEVDWLQMKATASVGKFFGTCIKNVYHCEQIL